jgi:hypothetical protein
VRPARWQQPPPVGEPLASGAEVQATLVPTEPLDLQGYLPLVDTDQVRAVPNTEQILNAMLTASVRAYHRPVTVQAASGIFNQDGRAVVAIQVTFAGGETVVLLPSDPPTPIVQAQAELPYPLKDTLLGKPIEGWYQYRVIVAWQDGEVTPPSDPVTGDAEQFFLQVPQFQG